MAGAVALLGVLCALIAALRHVLGAAPGSAFWPVFATLPIVAMRLAHHAAPEAAFWIAGGVLLAGALWYFASQFIRRALDAFLLALLAFQLFFVLRYGGTLLPPAGALTLDALSLAQKLNLLLQLALIGVLLFWRTRPAPAHGYEHSAPSRVTGFLKKRRMPARISGIVLAALAAIATIVTAQTGFNEPSTSALLQPALLQPPLLFALWLALDGLYLLGRTLWRRVH